MSFLTATPALPPARAPRGRLLRTGMVATALVAVSALGLPSALAAPVLTIPLDPPEVLVALYPPENLGPLSLDDLDDQVFPQLTAVDVEYGGTLSVQLPGGLLGAADTVVTLDLMPSEDAEPTKSYSTDPAAAAPLAAVDDGAGRFDIVLPAEDVGHGPFGTLTIDGITGPDDGFLVETPLSYLLHFTGTGTAAVSLAPQIIAIASVPCALSGEELCPVGSIQEGSTFALTVPAGSRLRTLGLGSLDGMKLGLIPVDPGADEVGEPVFLSDQPGLVTVTDSYDATVLVPAGTPGGTYLLAILQGTGAGSIAITFGVLEITELEVAEVPTPQLVNAGLHSDTGWEDGDVTAAPAGDPGSPALVVTGLGMLTAAGLGTVAVLRSGRRRPLEPCAD